MQSHTSLLLAAILPLSAALFHVPRAHASPSAPLAASDDPPAPPPEAFQRVQRSGAADLAAEYNLTGLTIPQDQIHTLLPRDGIPALTDPKTQPADQATWLPDDARIIAVALNNQILGVPIRVLDWHEVINTTIGGEPIAITYCPLCDSATVFSRRVTPAGGKTPVVLEFGVSGALYNSNVLMYDKKDKGLWSQLGMHAVSGPLAGTSLDMLPVRVVSFADFKKSHPGAAIVSNDTGHERDYSRSPYESYFQDEQIMVPIAAIGDALPRKTLGVGVSIGEGESAQAWFIPTDAIGAGRTIETPAGQVRLAKSPAGISVTQAPKGVRTAQTFYYSWSAFYPKTTVIEPTSASTTQALPEIPGLSIGDHAPDAALLDADGKAVSLASLYKDGPVVITFYRGGWCPYCNRALAAWHEQMDALKAAGGTFVALTPEKPEIAAATRDKADGGFAVYSDATHQAAKAFKVHFVVDEATKTKYEKYGLKVGEANASGTWELPAPATFVIDKQGIIRWVFADWDYKLRADPAEVIAAVKAITGNP